MDGLRQYVISIVVAALISSILSGIIKNGTAKGLIRLLCGLFLTFTVIRPLGQLDLRWLTVDSISLNREAEAVASMGENMARETMTEIIKEESEAYILDKAAAMNVELTIDITVSEEQIPVSAVLGGEISPYARERMEAILESDLGITKENQLWTG